MCIYIYKNIGYTYIYIYGFNPLVRSLRKWESRQPLVISESSSWGVCGSPLKLDGGSNLIRVDKWESVDFLPFKSKTTYRCWSLFLH